MHVYTSEDLIMHKEFELSVSKLEYLTGLLMEQVEEYFAMSIMRDRLNQEFYMEDGFFSKIWDVIKRICVAIKESIKNMFLWVFRRKKNSEQLEDKLETVLDESFDKIKDTKVKFIPKKEFGDYITAFMFLIERLEEASKKDINIITDRDKINNILSFVTVINKEKIDNMSFFSKLFGGDKKVIELGWNGEVEKALKTIKVEVPKTYKRGLSYKSILPVLDFKDIEVKTWAEFGYTSSNDIRLIMDMLTKTVSALEPLEKDQQGFYKQLEKNIDNLQKSYSESGDTMKDAMGERAKVLAYKNCMHVILDIHKATLIVVIRQLMKFVAATEHVLKHTIEQFDKEPKTEKS